MSERDRRGNAVVENVSAATVRFHARRYISTTPESLWKFYDDLFLGVTAGVIALSRIDQESKAATRVTRDLPAVFPIDWFSTVCARLEEVASLIVLQADRPFEKKIDDSGSLFPSH